MIDFDKFSGFTHSFKKIDLGKWLFMLFLCNSGVILMVRIAYFSLRLEKISVCHLFIYIYIGKLKCFSHQ